MVLQHCTALRSAYLLLVASIKGVSPISSSIYAGIMTRGQCVPIAIIHRGPIICPSPGVAEIHSKLQCKDIPIESESSQMQSNDWQHEDNLVL
ncbi:hypothetical protein GmHk_14G040397 [Glycine max]|nr:hypothetical protein GmHk_14G040397 [Glycine max]